MNDIQKLRDIISTAPTTKRKLKAEWTTVTADDLTPIISEEALEDWVEYFREAIDNEIMKNIAEEAKNNLIIVDDE